MDNSCHEQLIMQGGKRFEFVDIVEAEESELKELMLRGTMPDLKSVAGWEFKGRNISAISAAINMRRFIKGFCAVPEGVESPEIIDGYNLWARQSRGLQKPWKQIYKFGKTWRHGFYKVHPVNPDSIDNKHTNALLIDYSLGDNPFYHPSAKMRDYFVQIYPDNPDLYIGTVYAGIGDMRIFGGYFVIERLQQPEII